MACWRLRVHHTDDDERRYGRQKHGGNASRQRQWAAPSARQLDDDAEADREGVGDDNEYGKGARQLLVSPTRV
jgi:hypothetical protein